MYVLCSFSEGYRYIFYIFFLDDIWAKKKEYHELVLMWLHLYLYLYIYIYLLAKLLKWRVHAAVYIRGYGKNQNQNAAGCDIFAVFSTSFFFVLVAFFPVFFFRLKVKKSGILLFRFHEIFWFFAIALVSPSRLPSHALFEKASAERERERSVCVCVSAFS